MTHAKYQVEVWGKQGGLVIRSEITDDVERAKRMARDMMDAMGERFSVRVVRDGETFYAYEWDSL
jgi:glycerol-3-phosphate O-acyltransferase